jgi:hypothetical protein
MKDDSRFAYFRLPNGTTFHLPRSVLDLAAAPARLQVDSLITLEALAASILGVPDVDFLKWGDSLSEAANELESKMARSQAPVLGESYGDSEIDRIMEVTSKIEGYCFLSISYDPLGGTWDVTVTHGTMDCGSSTYGGCEHSLTAAVNSTLRAIARALEDGILPKRPLPPESPPSPPMDPFAGILKEAPTPVDPPDVGEVYGVPLLSAVFAMGSNPVLGKLCHNVITDPRHSSYTGCSPEERMRSTNGLAAVVIVSGVYPHRVIPINDRSQIEIALCGICQCPQFFHYGFGKTCKNGHTDAPSVMASTVFQKPLEIWGYPLGSRVWIDTVHGWRLGKLDVEPAYSYKEEPCRAVVFVDSYSSGVAVVPVTRRHVIPALCRACGEPQFWTPAGYSCKNGHGEAPPLPHDQTGIQ